jgi:hypothetical protein
MTWKVFDCAEHHPNCTARNQTIPANPDIAGIGVSSFIIVVLRVTHINES